MGKTPVWCTESPRPQLLQLPEEEDSPDTFHHINAWLDADLQALRLDDERRGTSEDGRDPPEALNYGSPKCVQPRYRADAERGLGLCTCSGDERRGPVEDGREPPGHPGHGSPKPALLMGDCTSSCWSCACMMGSGASWRQLGPYEAP